MGFIKKIWADYVGGNTPITAAELNRIEQGVADGDITNPASPAAILQSATYVRQSGTALRRAIGTRWVFMGDSITAGSSSSTIYYQYTAIAPQIAGRAIQMVYNAGVPGNNSTQMLARFGADVLAKPGDTVHILCGTNDAGQAVPIATYAANMKAMVSQAQAAGWAVILGTAPPRGSGVTAAVKLATYTQNLWLKRYAAAQNIPLVDYCAALVDTTSGLYLAANDSGDGVHPTDAGHYAMATALASTVAAVNAGTYSLPGLVITAGDPCNLLPMPGGQLMGTNAPGATDTGASGWYHSGTATFAVLANSAGILGQWYSIAMTNTNTFAYVYLGVPAAAMTPGDVLAVTYVSAVDNLVQPAIADVQVLFSAAFTDAAYANQQVYALWSGGRPLSPTGPSYFEFPVPAGKYNAEFRAQLKTTATATAAGRLKLAQYGVYNLTALGIANL